MMDVVDYIETELQIDLTDWQKALVKIVADGDYRRPIIVSHPGRSGHTRLREVLEIARLLDARSGVTPETKALLLVGGTAPDDPMNPPRYLFTPPGSQS